MNKYSVRVESWQEDEKGEYPVTCTFEVKADTAEEAARICYPLPVVSVTQL